MYSLTAVTLLVSAVFLTCSVIVTGVNAVQSSVLPEITQYASLVFLPHGVKVLATCLFRGKAIPGLIIGAWISYYFLWGYADPTIALMLSIVAGCVAWIVLEGLHALGINGYYLTLDGSPPPYRTFMLVGILTSVANGFLIAAVLEGSATLEAVTITIAAIAVGDFIGLLVMASVLAAVIPMMSTVRQ